jgi:hypothetical protein
MRVVLKALEHATSRPESLAVSKEITPGQAFVTLAGQPHSFDSPKLASVA